jgi:hypothetical protein
MPVRTDTSPGAIARAVVGPFVVSRVLVVGALVVTRHVLSTLHVSAAARQQASLLGWDAGWYRDIARHGYGGIAREGLRFFPLFPLAGRALSWLPGVSAGAAVVVLSNGAAFALGGALYVLVRAERPDDEPLARRAVWFVYLAPPAYVLVMGYAEAVFMTAAVVALWGMRSRRWWIAAIAGLVAGFTRPVGILLVVPALVEAIRTRDRAAIAAVAAPAVGTVVFLAWAEHLTHDFFYPLRVQQDPVRRGHWIDPFRAVGHAVNELFQGDHMSAGIHAGAAIVFVFLLVVLFRRWPLSFALYATVALVVALGSRNLDSLERYGLATIPLVIAAADAVPNVDVERIVLILAGAGLVAAAVLAFTGVLVP